MAHEKAAEREEQQDAIIAGARMQKFRIAERAEVAEYDEQGSKASDAVERRYMTARAHAAFPSMRVRRPRA